MARYVSVRPRGGDGDEAQCRYWISEYHHQQEADEAGEHAHAAAATTEGRRNRRSLWISKLIGRAPKRSWSERAFADSVTAGDLRTADGDDGEDAEQNDLVVEDDRERDFGSEPLWPPPAM